ncbi:hypothetical protein VUJ46_16430 [Chryseobacterium sp. MYb264]|uniref:hypothetical protein n=1 Tax=Chryseobacterium sp. MYb264 TaxID=2745153 RepID=UPI002E0E1E1B|nr:hypothetical protein VUJ46_16430 [Chryseobacterium sp. MYb264]
MKKITLMIAMVAISYSHAQENFPMNLQIQSDTHENMSSLEIENQRTEIEYALAVVLLMISTRAFVYFKEKSFKQNNIMP